MLHDLAFSVTFPPSEIAPAGRSIGHVIKFDAGMTAITGPNEVGKSTVLEFANWALWGIDALRGVGDDYKTAKVALRFSVKGSRYLVKRTISSAELYYDGETEPLVKGTKAVNQKIVDIFGYGYKVFSVSNAVMQGELAAFGRMLPSERKRLIDSTIGLNVIDSLIDWVNLQAANAQAEADGIAKGMIQPQQPERPGDYAPSEELLAEARRLETLLAERNTILGFLSSEKVVPVEPTCRVANKAEDLKLLMNHRAEMISKLTKLKAELAAIPAITHTEDQLKEIEAQWAAYDLWQERVKFEKSYIKPAMSRVEIGDHRGRLSIKEAQDKRQRDRKAIDDYKDKVKLQCPECDHEWHTDEDTIKKLEAEYEATYSSVPVAPVEVIYTKGQLDEAERALLSWEAVQDTYARVKDAKEAIAPALARAGVALARNALAQAERKNALEEEIKSIQVPDDVTEMYHQRLAYEAALVSYQNEVVAYDQWVKEVSQKKARLAEIGEPKPDHERAARAKAYEAAMVSFGVAQAKYEEVLNQMSDKVDEANQFKASVKALRELKARIKMYLLPSLNKVASYLLQQMTGGVRRTIRVDEDFNIMVDGQRLETLSGSGKSVANLAVRIGLGQVLTNRVFSVLMADEIDADMDKDRAGFTAEALRGLSRSVGQIVLVSHKRPDADHYIELTN